MPAGQSASCRSLAAETVRKNANGTYDIEAAKARTLNTNIRVL